MPLIYNYIFILIISLFASYAMKTKRDKEIYLMVCFLIVVYVHSMVNVDTLPDLPSYKMAFEETFNLPWIKCLSWGSINYKIEPGYLLFYKTVSVISHNFQFFLWINSIILLSLYFVLIKKYSYNYIISILFLLVGAYNQSIFVLRQHLSAAILLSTFPLIRDRKQVKFLIIVFITFFIHQSSLVFIPVYYLYNFNKKNFRIAILLIGILLFFGFQRLLIFGSDITMSNAGYVYTEGSGMNYKPALIGAFWLLTYFYAAKEHVFDYGLNRFLLVMSSLNVVLLIAGIGFDPAGRLSIYYSSANFLLLPVIWHYMRKNTVVRFLIMLLFLSLGLYGAFVGNSWRYIEHLELVSWL